MSSPLRCYIQPIKASDGSRPTEVAGAGNAGKYVLSASTNYVFVLGASDRRGLAVQLTGYDAALIITSASIQDTIHAEAEITDRNTVVGDWVTEDPPDAFVGADGTGWSASSGVVAATGSGAGGTVGGAIWHLPATCSERTRLFVAVGGTGGTVRVSRTTKA